MSSGVAKSFEPKKKKRRFTVNQLELQEDELISEGGFGFVYRVHTIVGQKRFYALKLMNLDDEASLFRA